MPETCRECGRSSDEAANMILACTRCAEKSKQVQDALDRLTKELAEAKGEVEDVEDERIAAVKAQEEAEMARRLGEALIQMADEEEAK